jgi:hypothetical protein
MPNLGHIVIPSPTGSFWQQEEAERYPAAPWKRPWLNKPKTKGKVLTVTNQAVVTLKGFKSFTPLQVALMALEEAKNTNCDQVRVCSPHKYGRAGLKATADKVYNTTDLLKMTTGTILAPRVSKNVVNVAQEGGDSPLAKRWSLTENHVFTPIV